MLLKVAQRFVAIRRQIRACSLIAIIAGVAAAAHAQAGASGPTRYLYMPTGLGDAYILQFKIGANGIRKPLSPPTVAVKGGAYTVVVSSDGRSVYVPEGDYAQIAQFHVRPDGTLAPMREPQVQADSHPTGMVIDPSGKHAYVSCSHGDICQYRVSRNGALIPLSPSAVSIADGGVRDPSMLAFGYDGRTARLVADAGDGVHDQYFMFNFSFKPNGALVLTAKIKAPAAQSAQKAK